MATSNFSDDDEDPIELWNLDDFACSENEYTWLYCPEGVDQDPKADLLVPNLDRSYRHTRQEENHVREGDGGFDSKTFTRTKKEMMNRSIEKRRASGAALNSSGFSECGVFLESLQVSPIEKSDQNTCHTVETPEHLEISSFSGRDESEPRTHPLNDQTMILPPGSRLDEHPRISQGGEVNSNEYHGALDETFEILPLKSNIKKTVSERCLLAPGPSGIRPPSEVTKSEFGSRVRGSSRSSSDLRLGKEESSTLEKKPPEAKWDSKVPRPSSRIPKKSIQSGSYGSKK